MKLPTGLLLMLLTAIAAGAQDAPISVSNAPPPGFENIGAPQTTLVDVYYGGTFKVSTLARFDLSTIRFLAAGEIIAALDNIADTEAVARSLAEPLPHNANRLCRYAGETDCGTLSPVVAGVIFDETRFRADLFIDPSLLTTRTLYRSRYLDAPSTGFSTVHGLSASLAGGSGAGDSAFSLAGDTVVALGANRLNTHYVLDSDGPMVSELSMQRDIPGWQLEAGAFRSYGSSFAFVPEQTITGIRVAGSLDTRADLAAADATPIYLYLAHRSRVDVYRDEQLLDSGFYDAGNQQLDTRNLPDGAYNLRVVINGADGREQELVFFFARTARLPPLDQPLYYLEAGLLSDDPNTIGTGAGHWVRGGTARRLTSTFGAQLEMTALSDEQFLQGGLFMLGQGWQLEAGLLSGTAGGTGASLRGAYRFGEGSLSFDYRNVSGHGRLLTQPFSQGTVSLSLPVFRGRLYGRAQVERRDNASANNLFGLNFRRPLLNRFGTIFDLDIAVSRDRTDTFVQVALEGRWRNRTRISTVRPHVDLRTGSQAGQSVLVDASTTYMARNTDLGDYSATVAVASELGNYTVSGGLLSQSGFGQFAAQMQHSDTHGTGFTANGRVSLLTADGRVGWGGRSQARAGLLVEIPGNSETDFDVIVDDQVVATAASGRVNVVGLRPYSSYEVRIEPRGAQLVEFDNSTKKVTLYPGNVASLQFEASTVTVVVGRLIGPTGKVVANARILGLGGFAGTDSRGWFQVEVPGSGTIDVRRADGSRCQVGLDVAGAADGIAMLGELVCR